MASIPIKYIGKRPFYVDGNYGTYVRFEKGQTVGIPEEAALKMLRHPDQYERGSVAEATTFAEVKTPVNTKDDTEEESQQARDSVAQMNKMALVEYVQTHFGQTLLNERLPDMRVKATRLIDQFGLGGR